MIVRLPFCARGFLISAGAGLLITGSAVVYADDTQESQKTTTSVTAPAPPETGRNPQNTLKSAVQRELEALYRKQGRPAPSLNRAAAAQQIQRKDAASPRTRNRRPAKTSHAKSPLRSALQKLAKPFQRTNTKRPPAARVSRHSGIQHAHQSVGAGSANRLHNVSHQTHSSSASSKAPSSANGRSASSRETSPVFQQLKALYARDGRKMPAMDAPSSQKSQPQASHSAPHQQIRRRHPRTGHQHSPIKRFFRNVKNDVAQLLGNDEEAATGASQHEHTGQRSRRKSRLRIHPRRRFPNSRVTDAEQPPRRLPGSMVQEQDGTNRDQDAPSLHPLPEAPDAETEKQANSEPNPFPEMSEEKADRLSGPYTGMSLDQASGEQADVSQETPEEGHQDKLEQLAARKNRKGLKGFCPVVLRDKRDLAEAKAQFSATYRGKTYHFSSDEARDTFEASPAQYAPVAGGNDIVLLNETNQKIEGTLDHAIWYKDRLYLFSSVQTLQSFVSDPHRFAVTK